MQNYLRHVLVLFVCLQVSKLIVLDPQKRLSVREALQHPWVLGKAARFSHMDTTQRKLQEFNARRKLKVREAEERSPVPASITCETSAEVHMRLQL